MAICIDAHGVAELSLAEKDNEAADLSMDFFSISDLRDRIIVAGHTGAASWFSEQNGEHLFKH
jgi:hypothetical protein